MNKVAGLSLPNEDSVLPTNIPKIRCGYCGKSFMLQMPALETDQQPANRSLPENQ